MANLSKERRDRMIAKLEELKIQHNDDKSIAALNEIENALREKKYGIVFEEHQEEVDVKLKKYIPVLVEDEKRKICSDIEYPWNFIIEGDNLQALYLLEKTHRKKVDCIYIDPPYNSGAHDWKYNNDYVDSTDEYRHSKWLSMMKTRLVVARKLLNPKNSVMIVTIDEKEYLHLGCLLEELFPDSHIQMVSINIHPGGVARENEFARSDEYAFFVFLGSSGPQTLELSKDWLIGIEKTSRDKVHWRGLMRSGRDDMREDSPNLFYPIFVTEDGKKFVGVGDSVPLGVNRNTVIPPKGQIAVFPIHKNGSEGRWQCSKETVLKLQSEGFVQLGGFTKRGLTINYLAEGERKKIEDGHFKIVGHSEDGSLILDDADYNPRFIPTTQWQIKSHDALRNGANLINTMLGSKRFDFPKSLYAVYDTLKFIVANNPNAIIVDFFAGSGTTQHAVNLLNKADGGKRVCIMVTNNEISENDELNFAVNNFGNEDIVKWDKNPSEKGAKFEINYESDLFKKYKDKYGIAKYVTWPRTFCSIKGVKVDESPIDGFYGIEVDDFEEIDSERFVDVDTGKKNKKKLFVSIKRQIYPELSQFKCSDGFTCNIKFMKCDWIERNPEDYLLSNALCMHIKEMIELHTFKEIDGIKNIILYSKSDYNRLIQNVENLDAIESIWVNENIIFNSNELKTLKKYGFKYIPREFFSQELKEVGEYV